MGERPEHNPEEPQQSREELLKNGNSETLRTFLQEIIQFGSNSQKMTKEEYHAQYTRIFWDMTLLDVAIQNPDLKAETLDGIQEFVHSSDYFRSIPTEHLDEDSQKKRRVLEAALEAVSRRLEKNKDYFLDKVRSLLQPENLQPFRIYDTVYELERLCLDVKSSLDEDIAEEIGKSLPSLLRNMDGSIGVLHLNRLMSYIFEYGGEDEVLAVIGSELEVLKERYPDDQLVDVIKFIWVLYRNDNYRGQKKADNLLDRNMEQYGVKFSELRQQWDKSSNDKISSIERNLISMAKLENVKPGISNFLIREYGIYDFSRYPEDLLEDQFEQHDNDVPYGLIMYPRNDHNGAFYQGKHVLDSLSKQLSKHGVHVRVVECEGRFDVARQLVRMNKKYGEANKISFAIVGGHGNTDSIEFGGSDKPHTLKIEDLQGGGTQRASSFFVDKPTIMLVSCSTGAENGIGQELSVKLGAKVVAPSTPTNLEDIKVRNKGGDLQFIVKYGDSQTTRRYRAGKRS